MKHTNEFEYKIRYWNPSVGYAKIREKVLARIDAVLETGNMILGPEVDLFEKNLAKFVGTKYAVGLNSGTDALYLAFLALGIGPGDEVITVSNTFIATIQTIALTGATPILVDVGEDGLMDMEEVRKAVTDKTKAVVPVHLSGDVCDMAILKSFWKGLIIEDAAQALGAVVPMGDVQCFSFYPAKILGAYGDAGAVTTDSEEIYNKIRALRDHNLIGKASPVEPTMYGVNSRLDSVQAAVLNVKLEHIRETLEHRRRMAERYSAGLSLVKEVTLPVDSSLRVWQDYVIRVEDRDGLAKFLDDKGIKVRGQGLYANHSYKGLGFDGVLLPKTDEHVYNSLRLPLNAEIEGKDVDEVIAAINQFFYA